MRGERGDQSEPGFELVGCGVSFNPFNANQKLHARLIPWLAGGDANPRRSRFAERDLWNVSRDHSGFGKSCFEFWICNADIDFFVQSFDELCGRALRNTNAEPCTCFVVRQRVAQKRNPFGAASC